MLLCDAGVRWCCAECTALYRVQDYRIAVDSIKANVGLDEADILDVRGNHDTFSVKARSE
jgi:hypothetical protein